MDLGRGLRAEGLQGLLWCDLPCASHSQRRQLTQTGRWTLLWQVSSKELANLLWIPFLFLNGVPTRHILEHELVMVCSMKRPLELVHWVSKGALRGPWGLVGVRWRPCGHSVWTQVGPTWEYLVKFCKTRKNQSWFKYSAQFKLT